ARDRGARAPPSRQRGPADARPVPAFEGAHFRAPGDQGEGPAMNRPTGTRLAGRVALITGGASGLGEAAARRFHAEGAWVMIADIDAPRGKGLARYLGDGAAFVACDHTDRAENAAAVAATEAEFGGLDILYNNAGGP